MRKKNTIISAVVTASLFLGACSAAVDTATPKNTTTTTTTLSPEDEQKKQDTVDKINAGLDNNRKIRELDQIQVLTKELEDIAILGSTGGYIGDASCAKMEELLNLTDKLVAEGTLDLGAEYDRDGMETSFLNLTGCIGGRQVINGTNV